MSVINAYQKDVASGQIRDDQQQRQVLSVLDEILDKVKKPQSLWQRLTRAYPDISGLYVWGGVGIGKTYMMDLFCRQLPQKKTSRMHFHAFMQLVHAELKALEGTSDPLFQVAKQIAKHSRVICFDEFFVNDIADAMILAGLFEALFDRGVVLVATSNVQPDDLYRSGLQRTRFLPAIEMIKTHCQVMHLSTQQDYRLEKLQASGVFFVDDESSVKTLYQTITTTDEQLTGPLEIDERMIEAVARTPHVAWFEFDKLCNQPRSQMDYLMIADEFDTIILTQVPQIQADAIDKIVYLIHLIDILYDKRVKLILSSAVPIELLYPKGPKVFEFQRTLSRLQEMQSSEYLKQAHIWAD